MIVDYDVGRRANLRQLGDLIRRARVARGLGIRQVCERSFGLVRPRALREIELGKRVTSSRVLHRLAFVCAVDLNKLMRLADRPQDQHKRCGHIDCSYCPRIGVWPTTRKERRVFGWRSATLAMARRYVLETCLRQQADVHVAELREYLGEIFQGVTGEQIAREWAAEVRDQCTDVSDKSSEEA